MEFPKGEPLDASDDAADSTVRRLPIQADRDAEQQTVFGHSVDRFGPSLACSQSMRSIFAVLRHAAAAQLTVLFEGESGTGKDILAASLHQEGPRSRAPFIVVDCGAISASLIESELFGHEGGAFTGARTKRVGAFEAADGGTIFLDEVGELPMELQPKLLRFLENRTFKPVGSNQHRWADVRVVAATNKRLEDAVISGAFRRDLYYRLAVIRVEVPSLAERPEDIPILAEAFLRKVHVESHAPTRAISKELLAALAKHSWPGNVRELRNAMERYALFGSLEPGLLLGVEHRVPVRASDSVFDFKALDGLSYAAAKERMMLEFHNLFLGRALSRARGSITIAAEALGLPRPSLSRLLINLKARTSKEPGE